MKIAIVEADERQCRELCALLEAHRYRTLTKGSMEELEKCLQEETCLVVILDIDTVPVDNRKVRQLTLKYPGVYFLGLSERSYNPELREAICYHIYACMRKPVDPEELCYWLKCIREEERA